MHSKNIFHRDLKLENLLIDQEYKIKLCDFGSAVIGINKKHSDICGTYEYLAPEIIRTYEQRKNRKKEEGGVKGEELGGGMKEVEGKGGREEEGGKREEEIGREEGGEREDEGGYNYKVDIWGLGVLLYEIFNGKTPFRKRGDGKEEIMRRIVEEEVGWGGGRGKGDLEELIAGMLEKDVERRWEIVEILESRWVKRMEGGREEGIEGFCKYDMEGGMQGYSRVRWEKEEGGEEKEQKEEEEGEGKEEEETGEQEKGGRENVTNEEGDEGEISWTPREFGRRRG